LFPAAAIIVIGQENHFQRPGGSHRTPAAADQPDTVVAAPVFVGDELFCWVASVLHHADVGGSVMGSFCVDATDIFTDPPPFPPFKLVSRGEVRRDLEEMFLRQSRVPTNVHMDLRAAISANRVAAGRIVALIDQYGVDAVKAVMNRVLDAGERTVTQRLSKIPDGRWSHRMHAEAARTGDTGVYGYQLTVRKEGEHLYVENAGTDPQTGSINVTYAGFSGAFLAALTASLTADLAGAYGGVYRRVHLEPVPGTLSCADFPAAVSPAGIYTMETLISLSGAVIGKMLACAEPEVARLATGLAHPVFYGFISGGVRPTGEPFVATNADNMIGSLAASPAGDGVDFGGHFWIPEGTASNIEELELLWPMLFLYRRALKAGADGAGRFHGGAASSKPGSRGPSRAWPRRCTWTSPSPRPSGRSAPIPPRPGTSGSSMAPTSSPGSPPGRCRRTSTRSAAPRPRSRPRARCS
jgi:N-methylhydantoinase B